MAGLAVAVLGGAAIGLERQWSGHASGPSARFAGIRTFTLLGGLAGLAGWLAASGLLALAVVLLGAAAALVVAAYVAGSRIDIDGTTEVAALVVLAAGTLAGAGQIFLGSAVVAAMALLLVEKSRLHAMVTRIDDASLRASVRFAAMACIILPLLPPGPYGPLDAIRPRELWAIVLFFSGLNFVGWLARRLVGAGTGTIISGLLGGIISSTTVTLTFARLSRHEGAPRLALGAGVVAACTMMLLRVTVASAVLNPALAAALPSYVGPAFVIGTIVVLGAWRRSAATPAPGDPGNESPLQLRAALQMTALFQVVLFVILAVQARWSSEAGGDVRVCRSHRPGRADALARPHDHRPRRRAGGGRGTCRGHPVEHAAQAGRGRGRGAGRVPGDGGRGAWRHCGRAARDARVKASDP